MNNFSGQYTDLYINRANATLFFIPGTLPTFNLPIGSRLLLFFNVILVSNYHGFNGEKIKLLPYYMTDVLFAKSKLVTFKK